MSKLSKELSANTYRAFELFSFDGLIEKVLLENKLFIDNFPFQNIQKNILKNNQYENENQEILKATV